MYEILHRDFAGGRKAAGQAGHERGRLEKGLEYINLCREKGFFNALGAKLLLIEIYTQPGSKYANTEMAVKMGARTARGLPGARADALRGDSLPFRGQEVRGGPEGVPGYLKAVNDGVPAYRRRYLPRVLTAIGTTYLVEKKYKEAEDYFARAAATIKEDPAAHPRAGRSGP